MSYLIGFILVIVGTIWLITRLFRLKPKPPTTTTPDTTTWSSGRFTNKKWVKPVAVIGLIVLLYFLWDTISSNLTSLLVESDAGETLKLEMETVQGWLWVPGILFAGLLLMRLFKSKSSTSPAWGQKSFSEWLGVINGGVLMWAVVLIPTVVVLDVVGFFDDMSKLPVKMSHTASCTTQDEASDIRIDSAGRRMIICPEEKPLYVFPEKGSTTLVFDFSADFKEKHKDLLRGRTLQDFVLISDPGTYPGSTVGAWRIMPLKSRPELKYVSAWDRSGMKDISIVARAAN